MHPAFCMSKISALPFRIQRLARRAIDPASLDDALYIHLRAEVPLLPDDKQILFLPALYVNLDPVLIPTPGQLDSPEPLSTGRIKRAYISLIAIYPIECLPPDVFIALFPRLWLWLDFFQAYCHHVDLADVFSPAQNEICFAFFIFIGPFLRDATCFDLIGGTPGVRFVAGQAWNFLVDCDDLDILQLAFNYLATFMRGPLAADDPNNLQEFVDDGIGGEFTDMVSLVLRFVGILLSDSTSAASAWSPNALRSVFGFILRADGMLGSREVSDPRSFSALLLPRGILKTITVGVRRAIANFNTNITSEVRGYQKQFATDSCTPSFSAVHGESKITLPSCLPHILPPSLAFYAVLSETEKGLLEVADIVSGQEFQRSAVLGEWKKFTDLAHQRLGVLRSFNSRIQPSLKACDNIECDELREKDTFRRCAGCLAVYYCSDACQTFDWQHGVHRQTCKSYQTLRLGQHSAELPLIEIYSRIVRFMNANPATRLVVLFDYTRGSVRITVEPFRPGVEVGHLEHGVATSFSRAGRIELHMMKLGVGDSPPWLIPLRRNNTRVYDSVQDIVRKLSPGWKMAGVVLEIQSVLSLIPADAEIH
ncbi:hypothetical protein B0H17DRAFT_1196581 [Mycena rosella]|uniref:MYND-type domain-containing protein n=1 Tax=Mycena rosella TaxID=1033263 RepID=A0AAD7DV61_MYCRO|nr:hypothetical protein B0H17DRAFT_1196581 [Mycena rosella]